MDTPHRVGVALNADGQGQKKHRGQAHHPRGVLRHGHHGHHQTIDAHHPGKKPRHAPSLSFTRGAEKPRLMDELGKGAHETNGLYLKQNEAA